MRPFPALVTSLLTVLLPTVVAAQPLSGPTRSSSIDFAGAGASQDGFERATVQLRYAAAICFDEVGIAFEIVGGSLQTGQHYWFKGTRHEVPPGIRTTTTSGLRLDAVVMNGVSSVGRIADNAPLTDAGVGCYGQFKRYGLVERVFDGKPSRDAALSYLRGISISTERTPRPLRDMAVESALARMMAKVRDDSLRAIAIRDSIARRDSLLRVADSLRAVARRDSIARRDSLRAVARRDSIARRDSLQRRGDSLSTVARRDSAARRDSTKAAADRDIARRDSVRRVEQDRIRRENAAPKPLTDEQKEGIAIAVRQFTRAENLFRQGRYAEAMPIYRQIAFDYGPYTPDMRETAKARLNSINGEVAAQTTASATVALSKGLGAAVGFNYMSGYLEGDDGLIGISIHKPIRERLFLLLDLQAGAGPFLDIFAAANSIEREVSEAERAQWGARIGTNLPIPIFMMPRELPFVGGKWYPTVGYQIVSTGSRQLNLLSTGLLFGPDRSGQGFRFDMHFINGEPRYGGAMAFSF